MNHATNLLVSAILTLAGLVMEAIGIADAFLAALMIKLGLPAPVQIIFLVVAAVWLIVIAFRLLGRIFAVMFIVLLILLVIHRAMPSAADHVFRLAPGPDAAGTVHT
jgi:hypothetical protein